MCSIRSWGLCSGWRRLWCVKNLYFGFLKHSIWPPFCLEYIPNPCLLLRHCLHIIRRHQSKPAILLLPTNVYHVKWLTSVLKMLQSYRKESIISKGLEKQRNHDSDWGCEMRIWKPFRYSTLPHCRCEYSQMQISTVIKSRPQWWIRCRLYTLSM